MKNYIILAALAVTFTSSAQSSKKQQRLNDLKKVEVAALKFLNNQHSAEMVGFLTVQADYLSRNKFVLHTYTFAKAGVDATTIVDAAFQSSWIAKTKPGFTYEQQRYCDGVYDVWYELREQTKIFEN